MVCSPSLSMSSVTVQVCAIAASGSSACAAWTRSNSGFLSDKTNVAVSDAEKP